MYECIDSICLQYAHATRNSQSLKYIWMWVKSELLMSGAFVGPGVVSWFIQPLIIAIVLSFCEFFITRPYPYHSLSIYELFLGPHSVEFLTDFFSLAQKMVGHACRSTLQVDIYRDQIMSQLLEVSVGDVHKDIW